MEIREVTERPTVSLRLTTPVEELPARLGEGYGRIIEFLGKAGIEPSGPPFAMYYNMDMTSLDVEMGFPVAEPLSGSGSGEVIASTLPGGRAAVAIHLGPYETLGETYDKLLAYVEREGLQPESFMYECYLNDPGEVAPEEIQTEIYMPIRE
jgi:effector-binding domain-containing protein